MSRACTVCDHEALADIDRELAAGRSMRQIALRHPPLSEWAVSRHRDRHLSPAIVAVATQRKEGRAGRLLDRVERMVGRLESAADSAEETGQRKLLLDASRELRGAYELLGRLTGELKPDTAVTVVNVQQDPQWIAIRSRIVAALIPFPDARDAVVSALSGLDDPRHNGAGPGGPPLLSGGPSVGSEDRP